MSIILLFLMTVYITTGKYLKIFYIIVCIKLGQKDANYTQIGS